MREETEYKAPRQDVKAILLGWIGVFVIFPAARSTT
jgi:hypothetical protein